MNTYLSLLAVSLIMLASSAQAQPEPANYLQVPGPILFKGVPYHLTWSSHPNPTFYKQEYIGKGDNPNAFKTMLMLDVVTGHVDLNQVVASKIAEINQQNGPSPLVKYQLSKHPSTGEILLDFVMSQPAPDGRSLQIVERNVYRYKPFTSASGQQGVLLFGVCQRSYGSDTSLFVASLKQNRTALSTDVAQFRLPSVSIVK
ncbi:hypothetical protein [Spirosoma aerolatum]|uniref:hypothetical protein n=1 Tax=Spirosoma aerolatum TaxID=1211326 RepID=UPI0009AD807B|nr:hypothetical protein [Spirosoma aerolatum]